MQEQLTSINELNLKDLPKGKIYRFWLNIISNSFGSPIQIPIIVAKGQYDGITLGLTAAVHGNELNGIPVIQRIFKEVDVSVLKGTIIGVPVVNVVSFFRRKRRFNDGTDLNHIMPGKQKGNVSQVYAYRFFNKIIKQFDYLIDLHTASFGRINSYYIRADMSDARTKKLALLQNAQIIVHNPPADGTLRGAASAEGICAITLEVGNPNTFQKGLIREGLSGMHNSLIDLGMYEGDLDLHEEEETILCKESYWIYTEQGGILTVHPKETEIVEKGQHIATIQNIFGDVIQKYTAPEKGIIIGKSVSPVNQSGGRILHLGILKN